MNGRRRIGCATSRSALAAGTLLLAVMSCCATQARAQEPKRPQIFNLRIGFGGVHKVGYWTPVEVAIRGGDTNVTGSVELTLPDGDGAEYRVTTPPNHSVQINAGQEVSVVLYAKIGQDGDMTVVLRDDSEVVAKRTYSPSDIELSGGLTAGQELIVNVGSPVGIESQSRDRDPDLNKPVVVQLSDVRQLPTRWYGYEAVDTLVLTTSRPETYRSLSANSARLTALDRWISQGGRLVLCVGREADEIFGPQSVLASFAPGQFEKKVTLKSSASLESYAETSERLDPLGASELRLDVPQLSHVRGKIELHEGNDPKALPLVIRAPHGFGEVIFVAFDLDQPPISRWSAREQLFNKILGRPKKASQATDATSAVSTLGYTDLSGQLRSALDQFTDVRLAPFALVALLIVVYILCIGPGDYFFVKRVLRRMELTWITFPAIVILFSLGAYVLAYKLKGDKLQVNQLDIVDVDVEAKQVRGTTWSNVFSPQTETFNLSLAAEPETSGQKAQADVLLSWMGLPGNAFGGMSQRGGGGQLFGGAYDFSPDGDALNRMPIVVWSTKGVTARWSCAAPEVIESNLSDAGGKLLAGSVTNRGSETLTDCVLLYDRWAYSVGSSGRFEPGRPFRLDTQSGPQTVDTYFKHVKLGADDTVAYDRSGLSVPVIAEAMMFHDLIGGENYTRLGNQYQKFIDLSSHLKMGQAILLGRRSGSVGQLLRDGQPLAGAADQRWTFFRFILPVKAEGAQRD